MSRRRDRRRKASHRPTHAKPGTSPGAIIREAARVERLAYTRTQAAEALGVSRSTFDRRVLPLVETIEMPWGTRLIPVDELERVATERRRPARRQALPPAQPGRRATVPTDVVKRIRAEHAAGRSIGEIGRRLTTDQVPTAQGGARWWPSTVRAILRRSLGYG
ncbi:MAG TPA: recombinase family protein [Gaiellaceae bacterium]|nr:recombinase family protein [Gaiellaceae bacterium]